MRHTTTTRRHFAGYAKRKSKKPKVAPQAKRRAEFSPPLPPPPIREIATPGTLDRLLALRTPLLVGTIAGICVWLAVQAGSTIPRQSLPVANSPRYSTPPPGNAADSATLERSARRIALPTDQSFMATPYRHETAEAAARQPPVNPGSSHASVASTAATPAGKGRFHSTASGRCVVDTHDIEEIAARVEGCLRRPN